MSKTQISSEEVIRIAKLVNLQLTPKEIERFRFVIPTALESTKVLSKLNTNDVEPTFTVTGVCNVFLDQDLSFTLTQKEALLNAKNKENGLFVTQAVIKK